MFHITWPTFKFNRNQLGTVLVFVMISMLSSNQRAHQLIGEKLLQKISLQDYGPQVNTENCVL